MSISVQLLNALHVHSLCLITEYRPPTPPPGDAHRYQLFLFPLSGGVLQETIPQSRSSFKMEDFMQRNGLTNDAVVASFQFKYKSWFQYISDAYALIGMLLCFLSKIDLFGDTKMIINNEMTEVRYTFKSVYCYMFCCLLSLFLVKINAVLSSELLFNQLLLLLTVSLARYKLNLY